MEETFLFQIWKFKDIRHAHVDFIKENPLRHFLTKVIESAVFFEKDGDVRKYFVQKF